MSTWKLDADIEAVDLNGPFAAGSHGVTVTRSAGRIQWRLAGVQAETEAVVEIALPDAIVQFRWTFEDLGGRRRITQCASMGGEHALSLAPMASSLESGIPAGMQKCATSWQMLRREGFETQGPDNHQTRQTTAFQ